MSLKNLAKMINAATKTMSVSQKFIHELGQTIQRGDTPHIPSKAFKPSSLGKCLRMNYFMLTGVAVDTSPADAELCAICENGTDRHERLQTWVSRMKEFGYDCEWIDVETYLNAHPVPGTKIIQKQGMETKCFNETFNVRFLCDGIIKFDGIYYILEIKTESSYKYNNQMGAFDDHVIQACCYSTFLGIDKIMFLYEERDFCRKKAFVVEVTEDMKQESVIGRIETVNNYIEKEQVPPKTIELKDCNYCDYKKECAKWG